VKINMKCRLRFADDSWGLELAAKLVSTYLRPHVEAFDFAGAGFHWA
jgi:hypothetical protein